jgi:hypothetical protein
MNPEVLFVKVGDRVIISRPRSSSRFATTVDRYALVTAVRPKSFDAGGLCFRNDGREWSGHNRVRLISQEQDESSVASRAEAEEALRLERAERAREDVRLASLLSYRHEQEWLRLGLDELRRIAALHGIGAVKGESNSAAAGEGQD